MKKVGVGFVLGMLIGGGLWVAAANASQQHQNQHGEYSQTVRRQVATPNPVLQQVQQNLKKLGYYDARIDGVFGKKTQRAIFQYQYEMDLPITGTLDDATVENLKRPSLILNTQNFAPFHYNTSRKGEADGPVPQIVKLACREAGMNCRIVLHDEWKEAQEEVKVGKADGMFVIAWNMARSKWLHRSTAIIETEYGLFVLDQDQMQFDQALQKPSVLEGYTISVYGPSGTSNSLSKFKAAMKSRGVRFQINMEGDDKPLFRKLSLSDGKHAVYSNRVVGESIIRGLALGNTRYAGRHRALSYYIGFSKERVPVSLVEKFNQAYLRLVDKGDVIAIMANHNMPIPKNIKTGGRSGHGSRSRQENMEHRFQLQDSNGMRVVTDAVTCLMWQQGGADKHCTFREAVAYIDTINKAQYGGFSDWRMPTIDELRTVMEKERQDKNLMHIHPVFDELQQSCWSRNKTGLDIAFADYFDGALGTKNQGDTNFVRAVRGSRCDMQ